MSVANVNCLVRRSDLSTLLINLSPLALAMLAVRPRLLRAPLARYASTSAPLTLSSTPESSESAEVATPRRRRREHVDTGNVDLVAPYALGKSMLTIDPTQTLTYGLYFTPPLAADDQATHPIHPPNSLQKQQDKAQQHEPTN